MRGCWFSNLLSEVFFPFHGNSSRITPHSSQKPAYICLRDYELDYNDDDNDYHYYI